MSDMNNGYERTLDINILTYVNGVNTGSVVESGLGIFPDSGVTSYSGNTYGAITMLEMQELDEKSYEQRMNDFCDYLQLKYNGLIISNRAVNGNTTDNAPRRINFGACPITIAKHDITISNSLVYLYGISSDTQNITMSSTDSWTINGYPSIISVTPTSGGSTTKQLLQCTRTNWGNDTLTIQNLNNNQVASCTIQALYLNVSQHTVSLSDTNSGVTIGVSIAGGLDDYNVITSGDTNYFTVTKGIIIPGNTLTATNITVVSITSSQNRTLTITLQHVSNPLLQQTINVNYTATSIMAMVYMGGTTSYTTASAACGSATAGRGYYINPAQNAGLTTKNILYNDSALTTPVTVAYPDYINNYIALSLQGTGPWYVVQLGTDGYITYVSPCKS
jgi:hypothetical protein